MLGRTEFMDKTDNINYRTLYVNALERQDGVVWMWYNRILYLKTTTENYVNSLSHIMWKASYIYKHNILITLIRV